MKAVIFMSLMLTVMFVGCTHNHTLRLSNSEDYELLNQRTSRKYPVVIVTRMDGREQRSDMVRIDPDVTSWVDPQTKKTITVQTSEVSNVRYVSWNNGAAEGSIYGGLVCASLGILIAVAQPGDEKTLITNSANNKAIVAGIGSGLVGLFFGAIVGGSIGSKDVYHIDHEYPQQDKIGFNIVNRNNIYFTQLNYRF